MYISRKLKVLLKNELSEEEEERISLTAYVYGCSYLRVVNNYSDAQKELLLIEMNQRLSDYDKCETIEEKLLLENIFNGLGNKIQPEQVAIFFKKTIEKNPLYILEPFHFIERLKEIKS